MRVSKYTKNPPDHGAVTGVFTSESKKEWWYEESGWGTYYRVHLHPGEEGTGEWEADVTFKHQPRDDRETNFDYQEILDRADLQFSRQRVEDNLKRVVIEVGNGRLDDDNDTFAHQIADVLRQLIEKITPIVDELASENDGP